MGHCRCVPLSSFLSLIYSPPLSSPSFFARTPILAHMHTLALLLAIRFSRCGVAVIATTWSACHPRQLVCHVVTLNLAEHLTNSATHLLKHTRTRRSGHERFGHMTHVYYKYAIAAIIVFDLGRPATFESVVKVSQHTVSLPVSCSPCTVVTTGVRMCASCPCQATNMSMCCYVHLLINIFLLFLRCVTPC